MSKKRWIYVVFALAMVVVAVLLFVGRRTGTASNAAASTSPAATMNAGLPMETILIGTTTLQVEVASTDAERQQGLSGRTSLAQGHGMLFIFTPAQPVGFWMKDMTFSLDMVFADAEGVILKVDQNVSPATYPEVFPSTAPVMYVLEIPAGYAAGQGIAVGQKIVVQ